MQYATRTKSRVTNLAGWALVDYVVRTTQWWAYCYCD